MAIKTSEGINLKSTKQEILEAYENVKKDLESKENQSLNANKKIEEKKNTETIEKVDKIIEDNVNDKISSLKSDIINSLNELSSKLSQADILLSLFRDMFSYSLPTMQRFLFRCLNLTKEA